MVALSSGRHSLRVRWPLLGLAAALPAMGKAAAATQQEVTDLPGYGAPPSRHFSGFVTVDEDTDSNLFYYFVESEGSPAEDPLVWWLQGGPGASSLVGLFEETGPLLLTEDGSLIRNPYSWAKMANILFVEFAEGVGYSYCRNSSSSDASHCQQGNTSCSPCRTSDDQVASRSAAFLSSFMELFPQLKGRPLYLAGESYAGVYIPTLARDLIAANADTSVVNLTGIWVTDPCTDMKAQFGNLDIGVDYAYRKGMISRDSWEILTSDLCSTARTAVGDRVRGDSPPQCRAAWRLYDLAVAGAGDAVQPASVPGLPMYIDPLFDFGFSGGPDTEGYLNSQTVRKALHAEQSPNIVYHLSLNNNGYPEYEMMYSACNLNQAHAVHGNTSMLDVYREIIEARTRKPSAAKLGAIIINSGEADPVVNMDGTEKAISSLGFPTVHGGERRPWFYNASATPAETMVRRPVGWGSLLSARDAGVQVAGFATSYLVPGGLNLEFTTSRGSGHMVPKYAPQSTFHAIRRLLSGHLPLTPPLPAGWAQESDAIWYGEASPGHFTDWVQLAMSNQFTDAPIPAAGAQPSLHSDVTMVV